MTFSFSIASVPITFAAATSNSLFPAAADCNPATKSCSAGPPCIAASTASSSVTPSNSKSSTNFVDSAKPYATSCILSASRIATASPMTAFCSFIASVRLSTAASASACDDINDSRASPIPTRIAPIPVDSSAPFIAIAIPRTAAAAVADPALIPATRAPNCVWAAIIAPLMLMTIAANTPRNVPTATTIFTLAATNAAASVPNIATTLPPIHKIGPSAATIAPNVTATFLIGPGSELNACIALLAKSSIVVATGMMTLPISISAVFISASA